MDRKKVYIALYVLLMLILFAASAHAQVLGTILEPFERLDIIGTYANYGFVIDAILYFVILVGAAQAGLGERFSGRGGKAIITGVGIALAIGAAVGSKMTGFRLGSLWPLALLLVLITIGFWIYNYIKKISGSQNKGFAMLAFGFLFFYMQSAAPQLAREFANSSNEYVRMIWALLNFAAIICLFWGLWELIKGIANWGSEGATARTGGGRTGSEGPGLWNRLFGRKEGTHLDTSNPGKITVYVVDLNNNPINGAEVIIKGFKWRDRFRKHTEPTQPPHGAAVFNSVPSGTWKIDARHPAYSFYKFYLTKGTMAKHKKGTNVQLEGGGEAEVVVQLRREEEGGRIKGRVINETLARQKNISKDEKAKKLNKKYREGDSNISLDLNDRRAFREGVDAYVCAMKYDAPTGRYNTLTQPVKTNSKGDFTLEGVPYESNILVGLVQRRPDGSLKVVVGAMHNRGDYGRPRQEIKLSAIHSAEENVVVPVETRSAGGGRPPGPARAGVTGYVVDETALSSATGNAQDSAEQIKEIIQRNSLGVEGAEVWAENERGDRLCENARTGRDGSFSLSAGAGNRAVIKAKRGEKTGKHTRKPWGRPEDVITLTEGRGVNNVIVPLKDIDKLKDELKEVKKSKNKCRQEYKKQEGLYNAPVNKGYELTKYLNEILQKGVKGTLDVDEMSKVAREAVKHYNLLPKEVQEELRNENFNPYFSKYVAQNALETGFENFKEGLRQLKNEEEEARFLLEEKDGKIEKINVTSEKVYEQLKDMFFQNLQKSISEFWRNAHMVFEKKEDLLEEDIQS